LWIARGGLTAVIVVLAVNGQLGGLGGGCHCLGGLEVVGRRVVQLGRQYANVRKPQELFTQTCVFFQRAVFGPLNSQLNQPAVGLTKQP
jgi:hypothetical protein